MKGRGRKKNGAEEEVELGAGPIRVKLALGQMKLLGPFGPHLLQDVAVGCLEEAAEPDL